MVRRCVAAGAGTPAARLTCPRRRGQQARRGAPRKVGAGPVVAARRHLGAQDRHDQARARELEAQRPRRRDAVRGVCAASAALLIPLLSQGDGREDDGESAHATQCRTCPDSLSAQFDNRQKAMGKPTSDQMKQNEVSGGGMRPAWPASHSSRRRWRSSSSSTPRWTSATPRSTLARRNSSHQKHGMRGGY